MKEYLVTLYYDTHIEISVKAKKEEEAIEKAYLMAEKPEYQKMLIENLETENSPYPDIEEL